MSVIQRLRRLLSPGTATTSTEPSSHEAERESERLRREHAEDNTRMHMGPLSAAHRTDGSQPYSPGHSSGL